MRITNQIIDRRSLESVQRTLSGLDDAQAEVASGLRVRSASDDPAGFVGAASADRRLAALEQYRRNVSAAAVRFQAEEAVLGQITDLLARARELAISQAGASGTTQTRLVTKAEVDHIIGEIVSLANTKHAGLYLFGGDFADAAPFTANGQASPSRPPVGGGTVEIAEGHTVALNHDGQRVFLDTNVFSALQQLSNALGNDSEPEIAASITSITQAFDGMQDLLGELGARTRQLETASANIDALEVTLRTQRSDLVEVDLEEAITKLAGRQAAYQAALLTTARLEEFNLTHYLR